MGYIRSNEDYYVSTGMSQRGAKIQVELDKRAIDSGLCNPRKIKEEAEAVAEIEEQLDSKD